MLKYPGPPPRPVAGITGIAAALVFPLVLWPLYGPLASATGSICVIIVGRLLMEREEKQFKQWCRDMAAFIRQEIDAGRLDERSRKAADQLEWHGQ